MGAQGTTLRSVGAISTVAFDRPDFDAHPRRQNLHQQHACQVQRFCAEHFSWHSRYDRLNDDYTAMARKVTRENIRSHWFLRKE